MSLSPKPVYHIDDHQLVFEYLGRRFKADIEHHLLTKPLIHRKAFFTNAPLGENGLVPRQCLLDYLKSIEGLMKSILSTHSPAFWLFLYRRIKPALDPRHDNFTDQLTTRLVRNIVDLAIAKHGNLDVIDDIQLTSSMTLEQSWGGYLLTAVKTLPRDQQPHYISQLRDSLKENDTYSPRRFRTTNFRDIFEVEGLGYEYWLATARLRSIGKGVTYLFDKTSGDFTSEASSELDQSITRFDDRLRGGEFITSLLGVSLPIRGERDALGSMVLLQYNLGTIDVTPILDKLGFPVTSPGQIGNFAPLFLSVSNLLRAHSYVDEAFEAKWGFPFSSLAIFLWALSNIAMVPNRYLANKDHPLGYYVYRLLKRGYALVEFSGEETYRGIKERLDLWMKLNAEQVNSVMAHAPSIFKMLSLTTEKQKTIGLWSGGPRPLVIPYNNTAVIIDVVGFWEFLSRAFMGVKEDGTIRGLEFEEMVRATVADRFPTKFELGVRKIRVRGRDTDEIDLLLRKGDEVYVCECFSKNRYLNIEIGDPDKIAERLTKVEEKISQAEETCEYLSTNRVGIGYDYSSATRYVPIVVTPFIEWLPSTSARYWISDSVPRVMTLDELITFLDRC